MTIRQQYQSELSRYRRSLGQYKRYGYEGGSALKEVKRPTEASIRQLRRDYQAAKAVAEHFENLYKGREFARPREADPGQLVEKWRRQQPGGGGGRLPIPTPPTPEPTPGIDPPEVPEGPKMPWDDLTDMEAHLIIANAQATISGAIHAMTRWGLDDIQASADYILDIIDIAIDKVGEKRVAWGLDNFVSDAQIERIVRAIYDYLYRMQSGGREAYANAVTWLATQIGLTPGEIPPMPF